MKISFNPSNSNKNILDLIKNNKDIIFDLKGHSIFARGVEFKGTDTNTWRDIKINNVSIGSHTLDLRNGSNTTLTNTNGVVTINSTWRPVVDNLTSDSTTSSLSAKQGKVLKALIDGKSDSDHNHDGRYLKLTGGTMASNALITFADSGSWNTSKKPQGARGGLYWTGQSDYAKLYAEETVRDNLDLVIQFGDDNSNGLSIRNKANTQTSYISAGGVITTGTFKGNLDWSYITNKPASYTPSAHTHTVFKNNLMIKGTNGISDSASIHLGIGDSDTGFKWISDGVCQIYANNAAVGQWTSGGMNWFKNPTVNGNKVWNAGNDGSGSGLDADTLDGYHANGLLTALSNSNNGISITVGGTTKSISNINVNYAASAGNANTLDGIDSTRFLRQVVVPNNTENDFNTFSNMTLTGRVDPTTGASLKNAPWSGSGPAGGYGVLTYLFNGSVYGTQMAWGYKDNRIYIRNRYWGGSGVGLVWRTSWDTLALTSDIPTVTNYYWANVKISASSSTTTSPTVSNLTATNSIRMGNILLEHTNEINNSANDSIHLNLRNSGNVSLCVGGGKVGIGTMYPSQELYVLGYTHTKGFGIGIQYLSESELLPTISPGDGYAYRCLEIGRPTKVSCIIADKVPLSGVRGILLKFMQGFDGQIVLLKDLENYGSGNGYFWVMPSGCKIINADNSNILINQNQISNTYDDGRSRFFIYSSKYSAWIEFFCSNIY